MKTQKLADLYDAHYFATGCGRPYQRDQEWLDFFGRIAQEIIKEVNPKSVLDAGCAMGFLVEELRRREVEAFGVDVSEYAIRNVYPDIQPYCWEGSVADSFPQTYDLIVCIEVLEHMTKAEAKRAITNFCQHSDDILFSSTPFDYKEITHFNIQLPEYWAEEFARHNFFRDVDFDATFITPWAVRFRRRRESVHHLIRAYERRFWPLWKENKELRDLSVATRQETQLLNERIVQNDKVYKIQINQLITNKEHFKQQLSQLQGSIGWELLVKLQRLRAKVSPPGSVRDQRLEELFQAIRQRRLWGGIAFFLRQQFNKTSSSDHLNGIKENLSPEVAAYQTWIAENELDETELNRQSKESREFVYRPLISFITPVYNPPPTVLRETIESVLAQTYDNWELCITNAGKNPEVEAVLDEFVGEDKRIVVKQLKENLGISGNSNEALGMSRGEFVAILDHDDLLAPHMLYEVVTLLNRHPEADLIYFDEDKISADGTVRQDPFFKPNLSPHLLLSTNYLVHAVYKQELLLNVGGGFDPEMDGAQDWDLILRCIEKTDKVFHIPKILYHWRKVSGSSASDVDAKPWAREAQVRCIEAHLNRTGANYKQISVSKLGLTRIVWSNSGAKVSIIIPTKDKADLLLACISSILKLTTYTNYEIILVDTGSSEASTLHYYDLLAAEPRVKIVDLPGYFNYSKANNFGVKHATGDILLFLNNDTEVLDPTWLDDLVGWAEQPGVGIVGTKLLHPDGKIQHAGVVMGLLGHCSHIFFGGKENQFSPFGSAEWYRDYLAVTGACMMMKRDVYDCLNGFDETYQVGFSDVEICLHAIKMGYRVVYTPFAPLLHHEGATRGYSMPPSDVFRISLQTFPFIQQGDPFFNPNLSYRHWYPTLAPLDNWNREQNIIQILKQLELVDQDDQECLKNLREISVSFLETSPQQDSERGKPSIMLFTPDLSLSSPSLALYTLGEHLASVGYQATVYSPIDGPLRQKYEQLNLPVEIHPRLLNSTKVVGDATLVGKLVNQHDMVIANTIFTWQAIHVAKAMQTPSIWWVHEARRGLELSQRYGIATTFSIADAVIFPTQLNRYLYTSFLKSNNDFTIPYGLDVERLPEQVSHDTDKFCIVHVGSIEPRNGQDVLLNAVVALPPHIKQNLVCYCVGPILDEKFYEEIKTIAQSLEFIHFIDQVSYDERQTYLQQADIFTSMSRDEIFPLPILEAMALSKPIIATDVGGVKEVIKHDDNGLLIPPEDHRALMFQLNRLYKERETMTRLGTAARRTFEQSLTIDHFAKQIELVFDAISD